MSVIPGFSSQKSNVFDPLSLELWDPFDRCPFLKELATSPLSAAGAAAETPSAVGIRVDWKETPEAHMIKADLPGLRKEEVKVEVEDGRVLHISGERGREKGDEGKDTWHRMERAFGRFLRRLRLPENAKAEEVKAEMENGVLTVTVPKVEVKKPEVRAIEISGGD